MKSTPVTKRSVQAKGQILASAAVMLLLSAGGLMVAAQHDRVQGNVVNVLLALHVASWSYAMGIVGLVLVPMLRLIDWLRQPVNRESLSRYSPAEPRGRDFEQPERGAPPLERYVAPVDSDGLSGQSADRYKITSSTKVA